jgi:uncharacterized protein YkwD
MFKMLGMIFMAVSLLAACGGGGGSEAPPAADVNSNMTTHLTSLAPAPVVDSAEVVQSQGITSVLTSPGVDAASLPSVFSSCGLNDFYSAALKRLNAYRERGASCGRSGNFPPTSPLRYNAKLMQSSELHAQDMATQNYFSHISKNGRGLKERIESTQYSWKLLSQNIAAQYPNVDSVVDAWMSSESHCVNLMNQKFVDIGLSCVTAPQGATYSNYWAMDMGQPK